MSKLLKLKRWVSLSDAARYLSTVFEEPVTTKDLYTIALDGNLTLSLAMASMLIANPISIAGSNGERDAAIATGKFERLLVDRVSSTAMLGESIGYVGIFDLPMIGGEIEFVRYEALSKKDEPYDSIPFDDFILRTAHGELIRPISWLYTEDYKSHSEVPWPGVPDDVQVGVRVSELDRLVWSLADENSSSSTNVNQAAKSTTESGSEPLTPHPISSQRAIATKERNTLLTIVAALCNAAHIDPRARGAATKISEATALLGAPVDDGTVLKWLKQVPDAVRSRSK